MSMVYGLFDILALLYLFRSVQLGITIWRDWPDIYAEPLTPHKKTLAEQAAFFIAVPLSVFIHEAAHALAVLAFGGEVVEFAYRVFWGYVVPRGDFTAPQMWFIAVAGTIGSLLFGLAVWLSTRHASSSSLRYFGLRALRFQVYFSLVYYPIFTLFGFDGDWRTIYDFGATPLLSGLTAAAHAALLILFWRGDRLGWFEAPGFGSTAEQAQFAALHTRAAAAPHDLALQLQLIDALRRGGAERAAQSKLVAVLRDHPQEALAHLEKAALQSAGKSQVPRAASESAAQALALGLDNGRQEAVAHELIGRYQFSSDQLEEAVTSFSAALARLDGAGHGRDQDLIIQLLLLRNQAYRRLQQYDLAYADLQQALIAATGGANTGRIGQIEQELSVLNNHAGRQYFLPTAVAANENP